MNGADLKWCKGCGRLLTRGKFSKRKASADGLQHACRECQSAYRRRRRAENIEEERARDRERVAAKRAAMTPEERDAMRAAARRRIGEELVEQRERRLAYFREYRRRQKVTA